MSKITEEGSTTSLAKTDDFFIRQGGTGKWVPVQKIIDLDAAAALEAAKTNIVPTALDGIFIMYHRKSDNYPVISEVAAWKALEGGGEIADGVLVLQGANHLVISPTETALFWSSQAVQVGTATTDRIVAMSDWGGKAKTAAIVNNATLKTDGAGYAPGWCNAYSRTNANGFGITAGKWFMPAGGQGMFMLANKRKINLALAQINGATPLSDNAYWLSSETSAATAWALNLGSGYLKATTKVSNQNRVRAVAEFVQ